ncbi:MAG: winged helix-turn-helix transcriptional regulator [Candidatus Methanomethylophilaceae archaeon]|nr:winged helix-turn-helix transcriptional regulator [Candidatus Methanomethylophilaceae archaeon]
MGCDLSNGFEIYHAENGLIHISSDIQIGILKELSDCDRSLTELSKVMNKAQSTLSAHISRLLSDGVIRTYDDPADSRKRMYSLNAVRLAYYKKPDSTSLDSLSDSVSEMASDPSRVRDCMLRMIFMGLDGIGLSVEPIGCTLGKMYGRSISGALKGGSIEETVIRARDHYAKMEMAEMNIFSMNPLTVIVKDDNMPSDGSVRTFGSFASGYL